MFPDRSTGKPSRCEESVSEVPTTGTLAQLDGGGTQFYSIPIVRTLSSEGKWGGCSQKRCSTTSSSCPPSSWLEFYPLQSPSRLSSCPNSRVVSAPILLSRKCEPKCFLSWIWAGLSSVKQDWKLIVLVWPNSTYNLDMAPASLVRYCHSGRN